VVHPTIYYRTSWYQLNPAVDAVYPGRYKPVRRESGPRAAGRSGKRGMMRTFSVMRIVAAVIAAMWLSMAAGSPSAAHDDEEHGRTAAQDVRELVLKQRERVLAYVAAIMAGDEEETESAEKATDEASEDEAEDGEGEGEGGEEDGEEDGEDEGEDEGVGGEAEECEPQGGEAVGGDAEGDAAAGDESEGDVAAGDEADADEAAADETEVTQPAGDEADTPGDEEICTLPSTGTGSNSDMHSLLLAFAALAAVTAAGFGLRQRFV
jgi:hypothetical protein